MFIEQNTDSCISIRLSFMPFSPVLDNLSSFEWCHYDVKEIYEWTLMQTLNPTFFLFLKMICKKKKLSLVDGNFRISDDCFYSTSAEPQYYINRALEIRKSHLHWFLVKDSYRIEYKILFMKCNSFAKNIDMGYWKVFRIYYFNIRKMTSSH